MQAFAPFIPWLGVALAFLCLLAGLRNNRRKRLIESLPTSKTSGVFIGLVELKGVAESEAPLFSRLAEAPCVHYDYKVEESWQRTSTQTVTAADGKTSTVTRTENGWSTVAEGGESQAFYLKDGGGAVLVHPNGARLDAATVFSQTCSRGEPLYYLKGPMGEVADSTHRRRFTERAFRLHAPVFVVGKARERRDVVAPEIAQDEGAELFLISSHSEEKVTKGYRNAAWLWVFGGLLLLVAGLVWRDMTLQRDLAARVPFYAQAGAGYFGAFAAGWVWTVFNGLIALRNRVRQGWSLVDIQLKRRHDLIPNLVRIVSGLKDHEAKVQTEIAALRTELAAASPHALRPALVGLQEAYPVLKSFKAFLDLQQEPLRILLAAHPQLLSALLQVIHRVVATFLLKQSGLKRCEAHTGAVTLIQRFGSAANLNIHLHCLVLDGVYRMTRGIPVFQAARAPSIEQLQALLAKIITRLLRLLTRQGYLVEEQGVRYLAGIEAAQALTPLQAASYTYRIAMGPRAGQKVLSLQTVSSRGESATPALCANAHGSSLHAAVRCDADQRTELEQLCRYITRPAASS
jgi:hypothetical protein